MYKMYKNILHMNETALVRLCINYLLVKGHYVWRNNTGVTRSQYTSKAGVTSDRVWRAGVRGASDILGLTKTGIFIAVECKIKPNKPTPVQEAYLDDIRRHKGIAIVAYDVDDLERAGL